MTVVALRQVASTGQDFDTLLPALTAEFARTAGDHDRDGSFPFQNFDRLRSAGLLALTAPAALGGGEADLQTALRVIRAVAKGEAATALVLTMQYLFHRSLVGGRSGWTDRLQRLVVESALRDGALINALRVEPELGTPARGGLPATIARRTPSGWSLSGRKIYSTGAPALTWMVVHARTDEDQPRVGGFLVHRDWPGRRIEETWDHLGLRASASHDVVFEDTPVPYDHALDLQEPATAPTIDPAFLSWSAVLTSGLYDAVAEAARDWFVDWTAHRVPANLGAPLSTLPRYQDAVGRMDGLLLSNRALLERASRPGASAREAGLVKHLVTENAIAAVDIAIALSGNPGLSRANALGRHHRDVLCGRIHTPQADMVLTGAGKAAFADHARASSST
jgi:alkylation response protein AidB-like acyl-CoA dehydrogenase